MATVMMTVRMTPMMTIVFATKINKLMAIATTTMMTRMMAIGMTKLIIYAYIYYMILNTRWFNLVCSLTAAASPPLDYKPSTFAFA